MLPGADHEDPRAFERAEVLGRDRRPRPTGSTPGAGRCRSRCGPACPTRPRAGTARQQLGAAAFAHGGLPRVADLAEDLALADDHRVEPGRDREEVRDRGVVVVRVEVVGEVVGVDAGVVGEEVAHVADAAWKCVQRA